MSKQIEVFMRPTFILILKHVHTIRMTWPKPAGKVGRICLTYLDSTWNLWTLPGERHLHVGLGVGSMLRKLSCLLFVYTGPNFDKTSSIGIGGNVEYVLIPMLNVNYLWILLATNSTE